MSDWCKESDSRKSPEKFENNNCGSISESQWSEKQNFRGRTTDTSVEHLPSLSISDDCSRKSERSQEQRPNYAEHQHHRKSQWNHWSGASGCPENYSSSKQEQTGSKQEQTGFKPEQTGSKPELTSGGTSGDNIMNTPNKPEVPLAGVGDTYKPNNSIDELIKLSEQKLPVLHNGSYPDVDKWQSLFFANVGKSRDAANNGSDMILYGDSITEAAGYDPKAMQPFKNNFGRDNPTALGLGGDGTQQLLYRLNHGEMQGTPKAAVINIGTNDIGSLSPDQIAQNIELSIESIRGRSPQTKIVLMGILPRTESGDPGNRQVDAVNAKLAQLATADGAVQFVDLKNSFVDANGNQRDELYKEDKLHLSTAGYQAWADGIKAAMKKIDEMPINLYTAPLSDPGQFDDSGNSNQGGGGTNTDSGYSGGGHTAGGTDDYGQYGTGGDSGGGDGVFTPNQPGVGSPLSTLDVANIRGVNLSGAEWGKNSSSDTQFWPTEAELDYYKSKGMNTVRLMLSWEQLQPKLGGPLDTAEMNRLHQFLREAGERGMKVLVTGGSFARYTENHGPFGAGADGEVNGTVVGQGGVPISAMSDFWTRMVNDINADPTASAAVGGWDLTNEPHTMGGTWPKIAMAVDRAIRATGDQHTIVVEGDQWARDFSGLEELAAIDKNVAFQAHSYWDGGSGGYSNKNYPGDPDVGVNHIRGFVDWLKKNNAKGFVGEWGVPTDTTEWAPAVTRFIDYLDENNMGNMVWAGGPGWQPGYTLSVEPVNGHERPIWQSIMAANAT